VKLMCQFNKQNTGVINWWSLSWLCPWMGSFIFGWSGLKIIVCGYYI